MKRRTLSIFFFQTSEFELTQAIKSPVKTTPSKLLVNKLPQMFHETSAFALMIGWEGKSIKETIALLFQNIIVGLNAFITDEGARDQKIKSLADYMHMRAKLGGKAHAMGLQGGIPLNA